MESNTMARLDELQEKMQSKEYGPSVDPTVAHLYNILDDLIEILRGDNGHD